MTALLTVWSFLKSRAGVYLLIGSAALIAILLLRAHWIDVGKAQMAPKLAAVQRDLGTCHDNVSTLDTALKVQNKAVDDLKAESDRRVAESAKAATAARAVAESYRQSSKKILAAKSGPDKCVSADALILETVR